MKTFLTISIVVLAVWMFVGTLRAESDSLVILSGQVLGASDKHAVCIVLWDSIGFLKEPVQWLQQPCDSAHPLSFDVPPGRWAISAFEDRNSNGRLDMGLFGPKEPSGFWRPFHDRGQPRFRDAASQIDSSISDAIIKLR